MWSCEPLGIIFIHRQPEAAVLIHSWSSVGRCYQLEEKGSERVLDEKHRNTSRKGLHICTSGRRQLCLAVEVIGPGVNLGRLHPTTL